MDTGWAGVIGALIGSLVTGALVLVRDVLGERGRRKLEGRSAVEALLVQSMGVVQTANALRLTMQIRSGLKEGVDVVLRQRKSIEPLDLSDRLGVAFQPLFAAQASAWSKGSREVIPLANELVRRCVDLVAVATEGGEARGVVGRYVLGERWTEEQERDYREVAEGIGDSRRRLATQLRRENKGRQVDDLFGGAVR